MALHTDPDLIAREAHPSAADDAGRIREIYDGLIQGKDVISVGGFRELLRARQVGGTEVTMKDLRILLHVDDPKPTVKEYTARTLGFGAAGVLLYLFVSAAGSDDRWIAGGIVGLALWFAYTLGMDAGGRLFPSRSKSLRDPLLILAWGRSARTAGGAVYPVEREVGRPL